jgi:hypothetical protein
VIVYGSRHPISKRTGDIAVGRSEKGDKQVEFTSLGARRWRSGHWEPGGVRDWTVYWICWLNIFTAKC